MGFSYKTDDLKNIIEKVDFVMISDYMEESLVLMASELNWNLEDVIFFSVNRNSQSGDEVDFKLNQKVRSWNRADAALFDRANETFWKKVQGKLGYTSLYV